MDESKNRQLATEMLCQKHIRFVQDYLNDPIVNQIWIHQDGRLQWSLSDINIHEAGFISITSIKYIKQELYDLAEEIIDHTDGWQARLPGMRIGSLESAYGGCLHIRKTSSWLSEEMSD